MQGGNIALPSGYSSILDPITKHISPNSILKKHPVETIRWNFSEERCASGSTNLTDDWTSESCDSDDSDVTVTGDIPEPPPSDSSLEPSCKKKCSIPTDSEPKMEPDPGGTEHSDLESDNSFEDKIKVRTKKRRKFKPKNLPNVQVVCEDGSIFYADHVICTVPLGVLKAKSSKLFSPALPSYKIESINKLLFGTVNKIFLEYDRPFLNPEVSEVMLLWDEDEISNCKGQSCICVCYNHSEWFDHILCYVFSRRFKLLLVSENLFLLESNRHAPLGVGLGQGSGIYGEHTS